MPRSSSSSQPLIEGENLATAVLLQCALADRKSASEVRAGGRPLLPEPLRLSAPISPLVDVPFYRIALRGRLS